ncbi:hypothetical protein G5I_13123 [Acromyrmex echinatior]|uniref:Uncharacterized protein n=1 Tax=Acromyrmex echinatior TaxID=103372 RepID=F4X464_ACREC|nr:hypothetical protein G5I_13123 [Acromyrmex echinatior]
MSDEIAALLTAQSDLHGRMARSVTNLRKMGIANITLRAVEIRSTLLDQMWVEFEKQHKLIRALYKEAFNQSEYNMSQFADSTENTCVQQQSLLDDYRTKLKAEKSSTAPPNISMRILISTTACEFKLRALSRAILSPSSDADARAKAATPVEGAETLRGHRGDRRVSKDIVLS